MYREVIFNRCTISVCSLNTPHWLGLTSAIVFIDFRSFEATVWKHSALSAAELTESNTKVALYKVITQTEQRENSNIQLQLIQPQSLLVFKLFLMMHSTWLKMLSWTAKSPTYPNFHDGVSVTFLRMMASTLSESTVEQIRFVNLFY